MTTVPKTTVSARGVPASESDIVSRPVVRKVLAVARVVIGFTFLWAFVDKLFGLGFATAPAKAWINGGTPAQGFLKGVDGPFASLLKSFQNPFGDWLFMAALLGIGVAMIAGAGVRIAAAAGTLLMLMMFMAEWPAATASVGGKVVQGSTNPIVDSHWHEALLLIICAVTLAGDTWGLGTWWAKKSFVKKYSWLR